MKATAWRVAGAVAASFGRHRWASSRASTPNHLLSISDLRPAQLAALVRNAAAQKQLLKTGRNKAAPSLARHTVALLFSKRSTRTRVSTEAAVAMLGGHAMFLGQGDIQLGVCLAQPTSRPAHAVPPPPPVSRLAN